MSRKCIDIRQNELVQKDVKNMYKTWPLNGTKNINKSSSMLLDHCYGFGLLLQQSSLTTNFSEEGDDPGDLFMHSPGSAPGRIRYKRFNSCAIYWVHHSYQVTLTSIKQIYTNEKKKKLCIAKQSITPKLCSEWAWHLINIASLIQIFTVEFFLRFNMRLVRHLYFLWKLLFISSTAEARHATNFIASQR